MMPNPRPAKTPAGGGFRILRCAPKNAPAAALVDAQSGAYLPKDQLAALYDKAGVAKDAPVITYCGGGVAACNNALALTCLGFDNVAVYDGSLAEWTADPDAPMETG